MNTRSYHMPKTPLARLRRLADVVIQVNLVDTDQVNLSRFIEDQEVKSIQDLEDLIVTLFNNYEGYRRKQRRE
jgi:hypothetical protein